MAHYYYNVEIMVQWFKLRPSSLSYCNFTELQTATSDEKLVHDCVLLCASL